MENGRIVVASMKREHYETGVAVMDALSNALWTKEKCRIVIEYDPAEEILKVYKEIGQPKQLISQPLGRSRDS